MSDGEAEEIPCPECGEPWAARARRRNLLERVASVAYYYPYRCQLCRHRFRALRWGTRYKARERREFERLSTQMPVTCVWDDQESGGLVSELSIAGATLQTDQPIAKGQEIQLRFRAAGADVEVTVDMSMVRSARHGQVGVEFAELSREHERRLAAMVRDLLERMKRA